MRAHAWVAGFIPGQDTYERQLMDVSLTCRCFPLTVVFKDFIYLFLDRGERGRKRRKHQCVVPSHTPPTGDLAYSPGMYPDWELNQRPFGLQASTQSTEPHQPGHFPSLSLSLPLSLKTKNKNRELCVPILHSLT